LSLTNAARRFYTYDGTVILTVEDLIQWTTDYYKKRFAKQSKAPTRIVDCFYKLKKKENFSFI